MSHTPGPWTALKKNVWSVQNDELTEIATVGTTTSGMDAEKEANARLIAAAPDLLEACKRAYDLLHDDDYEDDGTGFLDAVIEKAEGREFFS